MTEWPCSAEGIWFECRKGTFSTLVGTDVLSRSRGKASIFLSGKQEPHARRLKRLQVAAPIHPHYPVLGFPAIVSRVSTLLD
jgi:hypothetical protein